jgi:hypothetical protein
MALFAGLWTRWIWVRKVKERYISGHIELWLQDSAAQQNCSRVTLTVYGAGVRLGSSSCDVVGRRTGVRGFTLKADAI